MRQLRIAAAVVALLAMLGASMPAHARDGHHSKSKRSFKADLQGFEETPAVFSTGSGEFEAQVSKDETSVDYELSWEDLEGATVLFAHIHLGQTSVAGGVMAFLCGGGGKPACGAPSSGKITGTITAADIVGPSGQGVAPGEYAEFLASIRSGVTYANIHTDKHPGGEIRGQIK
jgi:hypothetical protein